MRYITIIPARGGSKRLPNKNIKLLGGIPLIAHSILYAKRSMPSNKIWVSTDSSKIANIASEYGAMVIERPPELSSDNASTADALKHAVYAIKEQGVEFDYVVLLQATNPLRPEGLLTDAVSLIDEREYNAVVTFNPILRKMGRIIDGSFAPWNYEFGQRSQDMEPLYYENGLLYITKREYIEKGVIFPQGTYPLVMNHSFGSIDIDKEDDFIKAEFYLRKYEKGSDIK